MLRSRISMSVSAALLAGVVSITGCGTNNTAGEVTTKNTRGAQDGRLSVNSVNRAHTMDNMEMSEELSERVAAMADIRTANVLVAGRSAYVAVTLDEAAGGTHTRGNTQYNARNTMPGTGRTMTGTDGAMNGTGAAMNGMNGSMVGPGGAMGGTGQGMRGTADTNMNGTDMMDNRGMKRDVDMGLGRGLRNDTGTGTDAGMGAGMDRGMGTRGTGTGMGNTTNAGTETVTREIKDRVSSEIKKQAPNIDTVYVSANPDFVDRVGMFAEETRAGHPIRGFANEFGTMVERIFPTRGR
ncbi:YhcN/YlaJ family sporulation lipoprotein [Paenibacillus albidus]|uniref:YhcN/YlaJ family sporulation lipoprotein n=1 Tax=Paenibacillus albidus TaxID=2041023 RepID=UPI001BEAD1FF|nr:YhcN/YlaJ family sporulation lipoprotein [Paenibacillus albidus]MBT2293466.1 YhcN/YlaJ family sporulation lipoprotein [Paenibacillus albidus]